MLEPPVPDRECKLSDDGGRGGIGEVARGVAADDGGGKTDEIEGRDLKRVDDVGIVRRNAAVEDGVGGRVGGTL